MVNKIKKDQELLAINYVKERIGFTTDLNTCSNCKDYEQYLCKRNPEIKIPLVEPEASTCNMHNKVNNT